MFTAPHPETFRGRRCGSGQCVAFVQQAANAPHTSHWGAGPKVRGSDPPVPPGTAIATFDPNGRYGNHTGGRSHAAILCRETPTGLLVWDQWLGQPVHQRLIRFRNGNSKPVNDGDQYCVIIESA